MPSRKKVMSTEIKTYTSRLQVSETTRSLYALILTAFQRYAGTRGIESEDAALDYVARARSVRTKNLYITVIDGYRRSRALPALSIRPRKPPKKQFNTARISESFEKMLPLCRLERDRALLALLRYGGLRISEALTLKVQDISFPNAQLQVSITQSKTTVRDPLVWRATRYLREYIDRYPQPGICWLFPTQFGHLTRRTAEKMIVDLSIRAGYRLTPHDLRRLCATEMAERFGPRILMDYFGWDSLKTAEIYIDKARGSSTQAIMAELGMTNKASLFDTTTCWRCATKNQPTAVHCQTCGELLDKSVIPERELIDTLNREDLEALLIQILKKRGILK